MITKDNYEAYLLDLYENTISERDKIALFQFLEEHPDLVQECEEWVGYTLSPKLSKPFNYKALNFETLSLSNYIHFFIAYIEGELSKQEEQQVATFLEAHPVLQNEFKQFQATILKPTNETFSAKDSLVFERKAPVFPLYLKVSIQIAAVAILAVLVYPFFTTENKQLAQGSTVEHADSNLEESQSDNNEGIVSGKEIDAGITKPDLEGSNEVTRSKLITQEKNTGFKKNRSNNLPSVTTVSKPNTNRRDVVAEQIVQGADKRISIAAKEQEENLPKMPIKTNVSSNLSDLVAHLNEGKPKVIEGSEELPHLNTPAKSRLITIGEQVLAVTKEKVIGEGTFLYGFKEEVSGIVNPININVLKDMPKKKRTLKIGSFSLKRTSKKD